MRRYNDSNSAIFLMVPGVDPVLVHPTFKRSGQTEGPAGEPVAITEAQFEAFSQPLKDSTGRERVSELEYHGKRGLRLEA